MGWSFCLMILVASLIQATNARVYYIHPTNHSFSDFSHYTLQGYINRTRMYGYNKDDHSNSKLFLLPGKHFLLTDFVVKNTYNFFIHGNNSIICCKEQFIGIAFIEVQHM